MIRPLQEQLALAFGRRTSPQGFLAAALVLFVGANFLYGAVLSRIGAPSKNDFTSYYVAAQIVKRGMSDSLYYPEPVGSLLAQASVQHPWIDVARESGIDNPNYYLYPPLFAIAMLPLTLLSYPAAFAAWLGLNVLFLGASLWLFLRGERRSIFLAASGSLLLAGAFHPVWHHLKIGQSSLLVLLLLTATFALLRSRRETAAGLILSGAILLKLTPGILLVLLAAHRRWRAAWVALAGVIGLSLASSIVVGIGPQVTYFAKMVPMLGAGTAFYPNQSLNGFITRLLGMGDYRKADLSLDLTAPRLLGIGLGLVIVAFTVAAIVRRRGEAGSGAFEDGFASLVLASLLVSPISWEHHYVIALLPAWILLARWGRDGAASAHAPAIAGIGLALIGSYVSLRVFEKFGPGPLGPILGSAALVGGVIIWMLFLSGLARSASEAAAGRGDPARSKAVAAVLSVLVCFASVQFLLKVAEYNTSFRYGDFTSYYVAGASVLEGGDADLYSPATSDMILAKAEADSPWRRIADARGVEDANWYLYPPFFAVAFAPLALLSYDRAHDAWYLLNLACLAGSLALLVRAFRERLSGAQAGSAVILTALLWPALFTFGAGQANYIILLLVIAGLAASARGKDIAAGLAIAGATAIKLTPGLLFAWFLWKGRWRLVAWGAAGVALLSISGLPFVGWEPYRVYVSEMLPLLARGCANWVNQSLAAFASRLAGVSMFGWQIAPADPVVHYGVRVAAMALVGWMAWLTRPVSSRESMTLGFALVLVTTLFLSPISWVHHSVMTIPAIFILLRHLSRTERLTWGRAWLLAGAYTLIAIYFKPPGIFGARLLTPLASYHLAGNVVIWAMIAAEILHLRREPPAEAPAGAST
jgi:alpha-1,2-mannosyltransferase